MKRGIVIIAALALCLVMLFGLPALAQTHIATQMLGQPLANIAAGQIINNSGLPNEVLPGGITNSLTRGRDAVNAYRYAHTMLSQNGWYRGISEDHTPLLVAMVSAMEKEGYTSIKPTWEGRKEEILRNFWAASDTQNAQELGFSSLETFYTECDRLGKSSKQMDKDKCNQLVRDFDGKWK